MERNKKESTLIIKNNYAQRFEVREEVYHDFDHYKAKRLRFRLQEVERLSK